MFQVKFIEFHVVFLLLLCVVILPCWFSNSAGRAGLKCHRKGAELSSQMHSENTRKMPNAWDNFFTINATSKKRCNEMLRILNVGTKVSNCFVVN